MSVAVSSDSRDELGPAFDCAKAGPPGLETELNASHLPLAGGLALLPDSGEKLRLAVVIFERGKIVCTCQF